MLQARWAAAPKVLPLEIASTFQSVARVGGLYTVQWLITCHTDSLAHTFDNCHMSGAKKAHVAVHIMYTVHVQYQHRVIRTYVAPSVCKVQSTRLYSSHASNSSAQDQPSTDTQQPVASSSFLLMATSSCLCGGTVDTCDCYVNHSRSFL